MASNSGNTKGVDGPGTIKVETNILGESAPIHLNGDAKNSGKAIGENGKDGMNGVDGSGTKLSISLLDGESAAITLDNLTLNSGNTKGDKGDKGE